jgi:hypothetical protein
MMTVVRSALLVAAHSSFRVLESRRIDWAHSALTSAMLAKVKASACSVVDDRPPSISGFLACAIGQPPLDLLKTDRQAAFELCSRDLAHCQSATCPQNLIPYFPILTKCHLSGYSGSALPSFPMDVPCTGTPAFPFHEAGVSRGMPV